MRVELLLPALTEARSPFFRPIKYSLFPPLGLATLASYLDPLDEVRIQDEHVEDLDTTGAPDLVGIEVYVTSARRAYELADAWRARGVFVVLPPVRRDLIRRELYLVPNSIVVSRGCPHSCGFCYKDGFFAGGRSFYVQAVDEALREIERLPGWHLYFLDDHLLGHPRFAAALFDGMRRRLHDVGVMVNASFVFGLDEDDPSVFDRTVEWAIGQGVETATFHVLTPYPGTALFRAMESSGRLLHRDWDLYDTRHAVFRPARMAPEELEEGYRRAAYAVGWKKCEPVWDLLISARRVSHALPILEGVLAATGAGAAPLARKRGRMSQTAQAASRPCP